MAWTLGSSPSVAIRRILKPPFNYLETNVEQGVVARAADVEALFLPDEWATLIGIYETWNTARLGESDAFLSGSVGTTVPFTATANGITWSNVACWFASAPQMSGQAGKYVRGSFTLVNAAQALAALLRGEELRRERDDGLTPTFGTLAVGGVTLTLLQEPEGRIEGPTITTAATGTDVPEGPLRPVRVRRIRGYSANPGRADYDTILAWYDATVAVRPAPGDWFPISISEPEVQLIVEGGAKFLRYIVSLELRLIT